MEWLDFTQRPLAVNAAIFTVCTGVVWVAGWKIAQYADRFATATGWGHAAVGMVLLAGLTSLPEVAVSLSAAFAATPRLAVNNLLGSISMQIAILALADAMIGRLALTVVAGNSLLLLQVTMNVLLLVAVALALTIGDHAFAGAGVWTWVLALGYVLAMWTVSHAGERQLWVVRRTRRQREREEQEQAGQQAEPAPGQEPLPPLVVRLAIGGAAILVAGFLLSQTGEAIAEQTGLGNSFVGAVFVAVSTSLPEASSVMSSMKLRRFEMALSDIFGTNLFNILLLFVVDMVYRGGPVLNEVGRFSLAGSLLGALLAAIFLVGLIERRDETVAHMGLDSLAVLACYAAGLYFLYQLR